MPDIVSATIGSSLIQGSATKSAANTQAQAQKEAADLAYKQSLPWSTEGLMGSAEFDEETRTAKMNLSDEWKSQYDRAMSDADRQRGYTGGFQSEFERQRGLARGAEGGYAEQMARVGGAQDDYTKQMGLISGSEGEYAKQRGYASAMEGDPMAAGKQFYDMQKAIYAPEQEKDRLALESRLLSQGMLGSTGGAGQQEALLKSQSQQDLQAQYQGLNQAQGMINTYRTRAGEEQGMIDMYRGRGREAQAQEDVYRTRAVQEDDRVGMLQGRALGEQGLLDTYRARATEDLGQAEAIAQMPMKYGELGRGIGSDLSSVAASGADMRAGAAATIADARVKSTGAITGAFKDLYPPKQTTNPWQHPRTNGMSRQHTMIDGIGVSGY